MADFTLVALIQFFFAVLYLVVALSVWFRDKKEPLNVFISLGILSLTGYFLSYGLIYMFPTGGEVIINFLKDIQVIGTTLGGFSFFLGSLYLYYGKNILVNKRFMFSMIIVTLVAMIAAVYGDWIVITGEGLLVMQKNILGYAGIYVYSIAVIGSASLLFYRTAMVVDDADTKKRIWFVIGGVWCVVAALVVLGIIDSVNPLLRNEAYTRIFDLFFFIGVISLFYGFTLKQVEKD